MPGDHPGHGRCRWGSNEIDTRGRFKKQPDQVVCIDLIVKAGGDVNARDNRGQSALHGAALFGYDDVIKDLMADNANITRRMRQWRVSFRRHNSRPNQ